MIQAEKLKSHSNQKMMPDEPGMVSFSIFTTYFKTGDVYEEKGLLILISDKIL